MRHLLKHGYLLIVAVLLPMVTLAQDLGDGRAALVTIRFNQPNVYFDQQLSSAISRAVAAKPDVMFDVATFAPTTGNAQADRQWQAVAGRNLKSVVASMQAMGVPMERINVIGKMAPGLRYDETRVYVR